MQIKVILTGKTENIFLKNEISEYLKRINHYISLEINEITNIKNAGKINIELQKEREGGLILKLVSIKDFVVLLDERGKEFNSKEFSVFLNQKLSGGQKSIVFISGGAYGFSEEVYKRADLQISLSRFTFPHQLVRLIFLEQLYRAFTIIRGEKYHHD